MHLSLMTMFLSRKANLSAVVFTPLLPSDRLFRRLHRCLMLMGADRVFSMLLLRYRYPSNFFYLPHLNLLLRGRASALKQSSPAAEFLQLKGTKFTLPSRRSKKASNLPGSSFHWTVSEAGLIHSHTSFASTT